MLSGRWLTTRADGETTVFEAESEREATLLARESWPGEAFTIELTGRSCPQCGATFGPEIKRCPQCKERRDARKRSYLATVSFLLARGGWSRPFETRVRAFGIVGAAALAVREAKRAVVKPRARISEMAVRIIPIRMGSK